MGGHAVGDTMRRDVPVATRISQTAARFRADWTMAALDAVIITVSYAAALSVRFLDAGGVPPTNWWGGLAVSLPAIVAVHLSMNLIFGTYGHVWEFASVEEGLRIVAASMTSALGLLAGLLAYRGPLGGEGLVPISALVLGAFISLSLMGMVRFWSRMFSYRRIGSPVAGQRPQRTLIVGTGGPAANLARYHTHTGGGMDSSSPTAADHNAA
ncbi:MAG: hypothetical protein ACE5E8_04180 [Acidimicrobiia bacterium]